MRRLTIADSGTIHWKTDSYGVVVNLIFEPPVPIFDEGKLPDSIDNRQSTILSSAI
jgi:hypothetical protein